MKISDSLAEALEQAGFALVGQRTGAYTRWQWPGNDRLPALRVPDDPTASEYRSLVDDTLAALAEAVRYGRAAEQALATYFGTQEPVPEPDLDLSEAVEAAARALVAHRWEPESPVGISPSKDDRDAAARCVAAATPLITRVARKRRGG